MLKKIYIRLYIHGILVLFIAGILTIGFLLLFHEVNKGINEPFSIFLREGKFIQMDLNTVYQKDNSQLKKRINEISNTLYWDITYWKNNKLECYSGHKPTNLPSIIKFDNNDSMILAHFPFTILTYLDKNKPDKGVLILSIQHNKARPFLGFPIFIILGLIVFGFVLIPYSLYILWPVRRIMSAMDKIAQGDLSHSVEISPKNEFAPLVTTFNNMRLKIQAMIEQKQRLIADVSHELRSPLTRMRLSLELLTKDPEGRKGQIREVVAEIENLDALIGELLDMSRMELDSASLNMDKRDMNSFIDERITKYQVLFDKYGLHVNKTSDEELFIVNADGILLARVFNNIFSNLIKYAPPDSKIDINLKRNISNVHILIRDRGQGINPEEYEKLFEPFYRTDKSRSRKTGGTGLGLSIAKQIITLHCGKIWVSSPQDSEPGNVFNIEFPLIN